MNDKKLNRIEREVLSVNPGAAIGSTVVNGNINHAIKYWKRSLSTSGRLREVYDRRAFKKPSVRRKEVLDAARYRTYKSNIDNQ